MGVFHLEHLEENILLGDNPNSAIQFLADMFELSATHHLEEAIDKYHLQIKWDGAPGLHFKDGQIWSGTKPISSRANRGCDIAYQLGLDKGKWREGDIIEPILTHDGYTNVVPYKPTNLDFLYSVVVVPNSRCVYPEEFTGWFNIINGPAWWKEIRKINGASRALPTASMFQTTEPDNMLLNEPSSIIAEIVAGINENPKAQRYLKQSLNWYFRSGQAYLRARTGIHNINEYIKVEHAKTEDKLKTVVGKQRDFDAWMFVGRWWNFFGAKRLSQINAISREKDQLIHWLNSTATTAPGHDSPAITVDRHEGFVARIPRTGQIIKLVDRRYFTQMNQESPHARN